MLRRSKRVTESNEEDVNVTPLLDIVFIMLIFFIVTASFIKEAGIEVTRPEAETAYKQDKANIFIALSPTGEIWIDRKNVPTSQLKATIEKLKAENPQGAVIIQADRDSKSKQLMQVMDAARDAGITQIAVATEAQE